MRGKKSYLFDNKKIWKFLANNSLKVIIRRTEGNGGTWGYKVEIVNNKGELGKTFSDNGKYYIFPEAFHCNLKEAFQYAIEKVSGKTIFFDNSDEKILFPIIMVNIDEE